MTDSAGAGTGCDPSQWAAPGVRGLKPYLPGKPIAELEREYGVSDIIKLASNENPLGPSPAAVDAIRGQLRDLALYPDGSGYALRQALARHHDLQPGCITLGNGSNDVLVLLAETFLQPGAEAVYARYCFAVYPIATQATGATARIAEAHPPGHPQALGHDLEAMLALVNSHTRLVFIANPNNPTGTWVDTASLEAFIEALPRDVIAVVDEAYHEYAAPRGVPDATRWLERYPNLVVTRTFSKAYGLAGARVGYSLSSPAIAGLLNRVRQPFNVNSLALAGAEAALRNREFIERSVAMNRDGLAQLVDGLAALDLHFQDSAGNFVLVDPGRPAPGVYEALLQRGIIVRPVGNYGLDTFLRITVGTREQNRRLLEALGEVLEGAGP